MKIITLQDMNKAAGSDKIPTNGIKKSKMNVYKPLSYIFKNPYHYDSFQNHGKQQLSISFQMRKQAGRKQ